MSQFGKGLGYCLGLFLEHVREIEFRQEIHELCGNEGPSLAYLDWFYSAGDHIQGLCPEYAPPHLQERCEKFKEFVLQRRMIVSGRRMATEDDFHWAIQEAKDLLREIDAAHGVPTEKGDYE